MKAAGLGARVRRESVARRSLQRRPRAENVRAEVDYTAGILTEEIFSLRGNGERDGVPQECGATKRRSGIGRARSLTLCLGEVNDYDEIESRIREAAERDWARGIPGARPGRGERLR